MKKTLKGKMIGVYVLIAVEFGIYYTFKSFIDHKEFLFVLRCFLMLLPVWFILYGMLQESRRTFYVNGTRFYDLDAVIDTGSEIRNTEVGFLKYDDHCWFIVYFDGFEAKISQLENLVKKR